MDLDIELFKTLNPDFYSQYKTARIIVSTGGGKTSVIGHVTLLGNNEPVKGVSFSFSLDGEAKSASAMPQKPVVKKSADKGIFRIANLPEGTYNVVVKKTGFKEQVLTVNVANGETTNVDVILDKG